MIETDRTAIVTYQRCPREYWLSRKACGKGLQKKAKGLPLVVGSAYHAGAELLLAGNIEGAVLKAQLYLSNAFAEKGVELESEVPEPQLGASRSQYQEDNQAAYSAQEQSALTEGLIRGWGLERLEEFLATFEVIEVEKEGRANLTEQRYRHACCDPTPIEMGCPACDNPELVLMFRPDALVRERLTGDLYVVSWKTTSQYNKRTLSQCRTDMQSMSEVFGLQHQGRPDFDSQLTIEGVLYQFIVKGKRQLDDWDQQWKQNSHLVYGWKRTKPTAYEQLEGDDWSWSYKWPKEDGQGNSTLGKGWKKVPIWSEYAGGVKAWIEALHNRSVFPRHIDPFEGIFPQSLPVERRRDEVESWKRQIVEQEMTVATNVGIMQDVPEEMRADHLDRLFPQYSHSCHSYSGCQFLDICWNGIPAEPGELYQLRVSNHPETGDEND